MKIIRREVEGAVELLALVIHNPVSRQTRLLDGAIQDTALELLADLEAELPAGDFALAQERGRGLDLDETVSTLIGPDRRSR